MKNSIRKYALVSGVSLIAMALLAGFSYGYVFDELVDKTNFDNTLTNIQNHQLLFGYGIIAWCFILIADVLVAWGLCHCFKSVNQLVSKVSAMLRIVYSCVLGIAIYQLFLACWEVGNTNPSAASLQHHIQRFEGIWSMGLIVFGVHLMGIGCLTYQSKDLPKWLGVLLWIAGLSYALIHGFKAMHPEPSSFISNAESILAAPMAIAELGLAVYLIWKGGKNNQLNNDEYEVV